MGTLYIKSLDAQKILSAICADRLLIDSSKPQAEALLPEDYDQKQGKIRIHRDTKTGNDEWLPVVAPLAKLLTDGWEQLNVRRAEYEIRKRIKGTNLVWKGWYALRRGLATNL